MPEKRTRRVIAIDTKVRGAGQLNRISKDLGKINKNVKTLSKSAQTLRRAFAFLATGFGIRALTGFADEIQLLQDRLKIFSGSTEAAAESFENLTQAARFTKTSIASLGVTYTRIALATQELGLNSEALLATTVALQQSFRLAGATIAEARAATIQLSQGLSSGQLRGQELRSVLEQNAVLANLLAKELGIARGQLIKFAEAGKITSEVVLRTISKNFDQINSDAQKLGQTFEQSLIIAFDLLKVKVSELNQSAKLNILFAKSIDFLITSIDSLTAALISLGAALAAIKLATVLGTSAGAFTKIAAAIKSAATAFNILVAGIAVASFFIIKNIDRVSKFLAIFVQKTKVKFEELAIPFDRFALRISKALGLGSDQFAKEEQAIKRREGRLKVTRDVLKQLELGYEEFLKEQNKAAKDNSFESQLARYKKAINGAVNNLSGQGLKGLKAVNAEFAKGALTYGEYLQKIADPKSQKFFDQFKEGKIDVEKLVNELAKIPNALTKIQDVLQVGLTKGLQDYIKSVGTLTEGISGVITNTFKGLEDQLVNFIRKGEFEFEKFINAILDDLARLVVRQAITRPLAGAILGGFGGAPTASADGNVFQSGNVIPFQKGGVIGGPIAFPLNSGTGIAGEAGPEAIIPLERTSDGKLGVNAQGASVEVNIINQISDAQVETEETTNEEGQRQLNVTVKRIVRDALSDGTLDKALNSNFGLNRKAG